MRTRPLEPLPAEERVDEVRQHEHGDDEAKCVGGGHQTRSMTQRIRYENAKQAAAMPRAARSYIRECSFQRELLTRRGS